MLDPQTQREFALDVVQQLRAQGYQALWAGGCVRDQILGRTPTDYDVATNARPEEVRELFGQRRTIPLGAAFGVIVVLGPTKSAGQIEVATFRQDAAYGDGRRPDMVMFSTPQADAQRRDFTINGLFFDPVADEVIDYVGGKEDLRHRVVRSIGNPAERFAEDKLRMLRAVRFAAMFDFSLDAATKAAVQAMAGEINVVSAERIAAEMRLMFVHPSRARALSLLAETGLLAVVLPEVSPRTVDDWNAMLHELAALGKGLCSSPAGDAGAHSPRSPGGRGAGDEGSALPNIITFPLAIGVLLQHFVDHHGARAIGGRWKLSNKEIDRVVWLVKHQRALCEAARQPWPRLQRLLIQDGIQELLAMHEAIHPNPAEDVRFCRGKLALPTAELDPPPLITGDDLAADGIPPGRAYQRLLEAVRDAQLNGQVSNATDALALAKQLWQNA